MWLRENRLKRKTAHFRLPSASQKRACLSCLLNSLKHVKPASVHVVTCPKQGREMDAAVLHRVGFLAYSCPKHGKDFQPSAAPL